MNLDKSCLYMHLHIHMHTCTHTYTHMHVHTCTHSYAHIHMHTHPSSLQDAGQPTVYVSIIVYLSSDLSHSIVFIYLPYSYVPRPSPTKNGMRPVLKHG